MSTKFAQRWIVLATFSAVVAAVWLIWSLQEVAPKGAATSDLSESHPSENKTTSAKHRHPSRPIYPKLQKLPRDAQNADGVGAIALHVEDWAGESVGGALVTAWRRDDPVSSTPAFAEKTSNDAGDCFFDKLPFGSFLLHAKLKGLAGFASCTLTVQQPGTSVVATLLPVQSLDGRTVDAENRPVANAFVTPVKCGELSLGKSLREALAVRTGADGNFQLANIQEGRWRISVEANGFAPFVSDPVETGNGEVLFILKKGGALSGHCVNALDDSPAVGMKLRLDGGQLAGAQETITDQAGMYRFDNLSPRTYELHPVEEQLVFEDGKRNVTVNEGEEAQLNLRVVEGGAVRGRVFIQGSDVGVPDANLLVAGKLRCATDEDGAYEITGLWPSETPLNLLLPPGVTVVPTVSTSRTVRVAPGTTLDNIDFPVTVGGVSVSGLVVSTDETVVVGATVRVRRTGQEFTTISREDGTFDLFGMNVGDEVVIDAKKSPSVSAPIGPVPIPQEGLTKQKLILSDAADGLLAGTVLTPSGVPVDCTVCIGLKDSKNLRRLDDAMTTDHKGRFRFSGLPAGEYVLSAFPTNRNKEGDRTLQMLQPMPLKTVALASGQKLTSLVLTFAMDTRRSISGLVLTESGSPVSRARVGAQMLGGSAADALETMADHNGAFVFFEVPEGEFELRATDSSAETVSKPLKVSYGVEDIVLTLPSKTQISGQVVDDVSKLPVERFQIAALRPGDDASQSFGQNSVFVFDSDGLFTFHTSLPSPSMIVRAEGYREGRINLGRVEPGQAVDGVTVSLEPNGESIEGIVKDANGRPLSGISIFVGNKHTGFAVTHTDGAGAFALESWMLPAGSGVAITAYAPGYAPATQTIADDETMLAIRLDDAGALSGTVTLDDKPAVGCVVRATLSDGRRVSDVTDQQGYYQLDELTPGTAQVTASCEELGNANSTENATVISGYETTINFDLHTQ